MNLTNKAFIDNYFTVNYDKLVNYSTKLTSNREHSNEIVHEAFIYLYSLSDTKITSLIPFFDKYIFKIIYFSVFSNTSPFAKLFKKYEFLELEDNDKLVSEDPEPQIDYKFIFYNAIYDTDINEFERELFISKVVDKKSILEISKEINMSKSYVLNIYNQTLKKFKQRCLLIKIKE